jgi:hypothetical protein
MCALLFPCSAHRNEESFLCSMYALCSQCGTRRNVESSACGKCARGFSVSLTEKKGCDSAACLLCALSGVSLRQVCACFQCFVTHEKSCHSASCVFFRLSMS